MPRTAARFDALAAAKGWEAKLSDASPIGMDIESIFGENTFSMAEMRARLPKQVFRVLEATIHSGQTLDPSVADVVALAQLFLKLKGYSLIRESNILMA